MSDPFPPTPSHHVLLRCAAEATLDRPGWFGHALSDFARRRGLGHFAAAAAWLRPAGPPIRGIELSRLMLCCRPGAAVLGRAASAEVAARQAEEVAEAFGLDPARLAELLRETAPPAA